MASSRNCRLDIPSFRVTRSISLRVASSRRVEKIFCIRTYYNVRKGRAAANAAAFRPLRLQACAAFLPDPRPLDQAHAPFADLGGDFVDAEAPRFTPSLRTSPR